jgi:ATP-dependent RNA helicase DDX24/MAK5
LYHILTQQPGLVIVFVNAISALRRLLSLLKILQLPVEGLHGNMQQRARLKYLDRFRAAALSEGTNESSAASVGAGPAGGGEKKRTSVLVATDVAARGIDIKGVDLVVHYQVPTSADTYVHRSGRTGRARNEGASVVLVTPGERTRYRALLRALKRDGPLPAFPTVETAVAEARRRLSLAKRLDKIAHAKQRDAADAEWRRANAAELGIELDSDEEGDATTVRVIENAKKTMKEKRKAKAAKAFAKAAAKKKAGDSSPASDSESDSSGSESGSDDDDMMDDLVAKGFDPDDQTSHARLGAYERGEAEESRLRTALDAMLATPLGIKAAGRLGTASVRYPSRGEGGVKLARDMREKGGGGGDADAGGNAVMGSGGKVAAVKMLKAGKSEMGAMGAAPGGARGKKRRKGGLAGGARG